MVTNRVLRRMKSRSWSTVAGSTYIIETRNPGPYADTVIVLYDTDGVTPLASTALSSRVAS